MSNKLYLQTPNIRIRNEHRARGPDHTVVIERDGDADHSTSVLQVSRRTSQGISNTQGKLAASRTIVSR